MADRKARLQKSDKKLRKDTGVGTDAVHPRVLLDFSDEMEPKKEDFLCVVELIHWQVASRSKLRHDLPVAKDGRQWQTN